MNKNDLKKMALLGVTAGVMMSSQGTVLAQGNDIQEMGTLLAGGCGSKGCNHSNDNKTSNRNSNIIADNTPYHTTSAQVLTEDQLKGQLDNQNKQRYENLSPEGKATALKIASQSCKGQNSCKGTGGCKTVEHACKGQNTCAGHGGCAQKDKNDAVRFAEQKQAEKRNNLNGGSY